MNWADFDRGLTFSRPRLDQRLEAVPGEAAPRVLPTRGFGLAKGGQSVDQLLQQGKSAIPELQRANALDLEQQLVRQVVGDGPPMDAPDWLAQASSSAGPSYQEALEMQGTTQQILGAGMMTPGQGGMMMQVRDRPANRGLTSSPLGERAG